MKATRIFRAATLLSMLQAATLLGIATAASEWEDFLQNTYGVGQSDAASLPMEQVSRPGKGAGPRFEPIRTVEITLESGDDLDRLTGAGYDIARVLGNRVVLRADGDELENLRAEGWKLRVIESPVRAAGGRSMQGLGEYHKYTNMMAALKDYAATYPSLCRMISLGKSVRGRDLWALKITSNPDVEDDKPEVKLIGTLHGDEPLGTEMCLYLIDLLLQGCATNDVRIVNIVNNLETWVVPLMNPDGRETSSPNNANGYNLNRSFPNGAVTSQWLGNRLYGPSASTSRLQPEALHMMKWSLAHSLTLGVDLHQGALLACYPYDDDGLGSAYSPTPDDALFPALALAYATNNPPLCTNSSPRYKNGVVNGAAWYVASGTMADWDYRYTGCFDIVVELSGDLQPPTSQLPRYWSQNKESILAYLEQALKGVRGTVRDAQTGQPVYAAVRVEGIHHFIFSDPDVGDYHRLLLPGTYTLWFYAPGYIAQRIPGVIVTDGAATRLDVTLQPVSARFAAKVNFQPVSTNVPTGYLVDSGAAFGARENGAAYGWETDLAPTNLIARRAGRSQDLRYDTFCRMQAGGNHVWEMALPNGPYSVLLGTGDPLTRTNRYEVYAEDVLLLDGAVLLTNRFDCNRWVENLGTVIVTDGRLTLRGGPDATNNLLACVEISALEPATMEQWRALLFATTRNVGDAASDADADQDGLPNLLEYAFGLNPTQADAEARLDARVVQRDGADWLACEFLRNSNATDLAMAVEAADDLSAHDWFSVASFAGGSGWSGPGQVIEAPAGANQVRAMVFDVQAMRNARNRFFRVQVAPAP